MTNLEPDTLVWFLAGMATPIAFGLFFLFFIFIYPGKKEESTTNGEPDAADETPSEEPSIRRTGLEILIYFLLAGLIYLLLFLFSFPILSFDGIVDNKKIRGGRLKVPWYAHEIRIAGTYHEVEEGIYHAIELRDHVSHGFFSGHYIINGVPHRAVSWIENMAFWAGFLLTILLALSVGTVLHGRHRWREQIRGDP